MIPVKSGVLHVRAKSVNTAPFPSADDDSYEFRIHGQIVQFSKNGGGEVVFRIFEKDVQSLY